MKSPEELLWLLARLYMVNRLNYVTSHLEPVQNDLVALLSTESGRDIEQATDSEITDIFGPHEAMLPAVAETVEKGKDSEWPI